MGEALFVDGEGSGDGFVDEYWGAVVGDLVGGDEGDGGGIVGARVGVDGGLGHEAVREGKAEEGGDEGRPPEEEEVPVEAAGFLEGEVPGLCRQGGDVVVEVEEEGEEEAEGEGDEDPFWREGPEGDEPASGLGGEEGARDGELGDGGCFKSSGDVHESHPKDGRDL